MGDGVQAYRSFSIEGSLALSKTQLYPLKTQAAYGADWGFHLFFNDAFAISASLGYDSMFPTSLDLGFSYKGFSAISAGLHLTSRTPVLSDNSDRNTLFLGSTAGLEGTFARYQDLPHYFFYLAAVVQPILDIFPLADRKWFVRIGLPVTLRFRKDMDLSMTTGVSLHLFHEPAAGGRK